MKEVARVQSVSNEYSRVVSFVHTYVPYMYIIGKCQTKPLMRYIVTSNIKLNS